MPARSLPGRLGQVEFDVELPARRDVGRVFDELDYQMACQVYLWALPLVSYAQWQRQHYEVFGATSSDIVHYVSYRDRLGLITANATTPYISTSSISARPARWSSNYRRVRPRAESRTSGSARSA